MPGSFPGTGNYLVPSGRLHVASYSLPLPIVCFCQHERFSCHFSPTSFQWDIGISATDNSLTTMWSLLISLVWIKRQPYPNTDLATSVLGAFHMTCVRAGLVLRTSGPDFHPAATVENYTTAAKDGRCTYCKARSWARRAGQWAWQVWQRCYNGSWQQTEGKQHPSAGGAAVPSPATHLAICFTSTPPPETSTSSHSSTSRSTWEAELAFRVLFLPC